MENQESFARHNPNLEEILHFKFRNGISALLSNYERWLPNKSTGKKVSFKSDEQNETSIKVKSVNLSLERIELGTFFCVSFNEMKLYDDYS